ncbi:MAG: hypothetical protein AB7L92_07280 [Alphaproteobacteria bacterium]
MSFKSLNSQQKLLALVAVCVMIAALIVLLKIWGINLNDEFFGNLLGTLAVFGFAAGILFSIISKIRYEKNYKDNFFNYRN